MVKERWHKAKYLLLGMMCCNLLAGPMNVYGTEINSHNVEKQVEGESQGGQRGQGNSVGQDNQAGQGTQAGQDNQAGQDSQLGQGKQEGQASQGSKEGQEAQTSQGSTEDQGGQSNKGNKGGKEGKQEATDPMQVYLTLIALFGIGSCVAVLSSILYKIYLSRKVTALPVLYYGKREEGVYEQ